MDPNATKAKDKQVKLLHKTAMMQVSNGRGLRKGDSSGSGRRNITQNELSEPGDRCSRISTVFVLGRQWQNLFGLFDLGQMLTNQIEKHYFKKKNFIKL